MVFRVRLLRESQALEIRIELMSAGHNQPPQEILKSHTKCIYPTEWNRQMRETKMVIRCSVKERVNAISIRHFYSSVRASVYLREYEIIALLLQPFETCSTLEIKPRCTAALVLVYRGIHVSMTFAEINCK